MTLQAYPVKLEHGLVQSADGSQLPEHARAVLVILPEPMSTEEWQQPFEEFFLHADAHPAQADIESLSDDNLSALTHNARGDRPLRPFGLAAGEITIAEDFDAPLPEHILQEFEGN